MKILLTCVLVILFCIWLPWNIEQVNKHDADCNKKGGVLIHPRGQEAFCMDKKAVLK